MARRGVEIATVTTPTQPEPNAGAATAAAAPTSGPSPDTPYMSLAEAAAFLRTTPKTVRRWCSGKRPLPHFYIRREGCSRGVLLFRRTQIDRWLRGHQNGLARDDGLDTARPLA